MTNQLTRGKLIEFKALFGPPPVLSTEAAERFEALFDRVTECLKPQDVVELILIRRAAVSAWIVDRLTRHGTVALDRWYRQSLQYQVQRVKAQNARRQELARNKAEQMTQSPADIAHLVALEDSVVESVSDVDEILARKPTEIEHNRALEKSILFQEQLNRLIISETSRLYDALHHLELYRVGLSRLVRETAEKILDAEFQESGGQLEETAAPPFAPSRDQESHDVESQNSSEPTQ